MITHPSSGPLSPETRITLFYFFQSMSVGAANAFAGIWFADQGLSEAQIGVVTAAPIVVLLLTSLLIGRIADRAADWRQVIVAGALASAIFPIGLFLGGGFWGILLFWTLSVTAQWSIITVADAAALRLSRRRGANFGAFRAWGTIGYLLVILISGWLLDRFGSALFLPLFAGLCSLRALASLALPRLRADPATPATSAETRETRRASRLVQVLRPWFLLPLAGWAMVYATHLILHGFLGLLWKRQGLSSDMIGLLVALSGVAETVMFFAFKYFADRVPVRTLILVSALAAVLRWLGMATEPGIGPLVLLQMLHAVSYALGFLACVNFIADGTSEDMAAEGQSAFVVMQQGTAILGLLAFGWFAGLAGAQAYWVSAGIAGLGAALVAFARARPAYPER